MIVEIRSPEISYKLDIKDINLVIKHRRITN